ncbi:MAG: hypothetical protein MZV65_31050 [Chromatiales bacterium]|nr:hypothetical protein [Chromatiales bacterium]
MQYILGIGLTFLMVGNRRGGGISGVTPCEARNLDFGNKAVGWKDQPLSKLKRDTVYTLTKADGRVRRIACSRRRFSLAVLGALQEIGQRTRGAELALENRRTGTQCRQP